MSEHVRYIVEFTFGLGLFFNAMLFVPQVLKIYKAKNAQGLSFVTFAGFNVIQMLTILHGCIHGDYVLIFGNILGFVFCGIVTCLIIRYKR